MRKMLEKILSDVRDAFVIARGQVTREFLYFFSGSLAWIVLFLLGVLYV